ncbi:histidine kinase dimerization/phosphoacceptor domain -containing protein [Dyadobacter crusticola]|uniref:histidine kinase dimerization/phosphoacceptor domain -containing protein n=1 Tax=Dyadobacter crusticola TaxID=292407 RepID=UPI0004E250CA|nr:histidine kinase dimerization/phosphoacceptor domain -containing protein [Dyadobacter crusticola]
MKSFLFSITAVLAIVFSSQAQPDSTVFSTFQNKISNKPDSARFEDLNNYAYDMIDLLKFSRVDSAIVEMMELATDKENRVWEGRTYMLMAWLQKVQSNSNAAVSNYQKAQALFQKAGDVRREIRALQRIGGVYITINDLKLAEHYFRRGLLLAEKSQMEDEVANMYTDFATVEDIRKNYNGALAYNDKALKIYKKLGADFSSTLFNRGIILKNAGRYQESLNTYMQLLDYAKKESDQFLEKMVYLNLPNTLLLLNRPDEAEQYVKKAIEMAKTSPQRINDYMHIYEMLTNIYKKKGQFEQALNYQNQWVAYRDSVFNSEKSRQLIEAETRFQAKENQERIQRLGTENFEKKRQLWWLYGGISMLAFLLAIALWQYRIIQRVNQKLEITNSNLSEANSRISVQATQLKELMQELHHRVKNNLAIVSSLLSLQASRLEDEKAIQAVTEGQQRVEAMSLIHQQLYQTDNVAGVSVKEYIQDLVKGLMQSFGYSEDFSLRTDIEPIVLDLKMAVPLGLIVNELITNAFKHAYKGIEKPELSIKLWQQEQVYLEIKDNGRGVDVANWRKPGGQSFGKRLVASLTKQINGKINVDSEQGSRFLLNFPLA